MEFCKYDDLTFFILSFSACPCLCSFSRRTRSVESAGLLTSPYSEAYIRMLANKRFINKSCTPPVRDSERSSHEKERKKNEFTLRVSVEQTLWSRGNTLAKRRRSL